MKTKIAQHNPHVPSGTSQKSSYSRYSTSRTALFYVGLAFAVLAAACSSLDAGMSAGRGNAAMNKGDYDAAIAEYSKSIELFPNSDNYNNRGLARQFKHDIDGAIADYSKAIELNPKSAAAYINRCSVKQSKGDFDGAIADCTKAIELAPKSAPAYFNRGLAKKTKGDVDGATADHNKAVELNSALGGSK